MCVELDLMEAVKVKCGLWTHPELDLMEAIKVKCGLWTHPA